MLSFYSFVSFLALEKKDIHLSMGEIYVLTSATHLAGVFIVIFWMLKILALPALSKS